MKNKSYCAVNTKYYKDSNASGEMGHVLRSFRDNKNTIEELSVNNFGFCFDAEKDIFSSYKDKLKDAKTSNHRAIQKNSNTFIDSVLIFDRELFDSLIEENRQDEIVEATKNYMNDFKEKYGFEPIGFEFHLDEGTEISSKHFEELSEEEQKEYKIVHSENLGEETYIKHNYHAHAIFLNYDFDRKKSCLRSMTKEDWSNSQDLLHKNFKRLGFDRGESKLITKNEHKEKIDYVAELQEKEQELLDNRMSHLVEQSQYLDMFEDYQNLKKDVAVVMKLEKSKIFEKLIDIVKSAIKPAFLERAIDSFDNIKKALKKDDKLPISKNSQDDIKNEFITRFPKSVEAIEKREEEEKAKKKAIIDRQMVEAQERENKARIARNRRHSLRPY